MAAFRSLFALLALLSVKVLADCVSYGIDYANGGAYYIDASSSQYFTFITVFQGEKIRQFGGVARASCGACAAFPASIAGKTWGAGSLTTGARFDRMQPREHQPDLGRP